MTIIEKLQMYFQFDFVRRAFVVGILVALCAALLGVILVLKRFPLSATGCRTSRSAQWPLRELSELPTKW